MSQTNGVPRVPKTCARDGCSREAPDTVLCWRHQATVDHIALAAAQSAGITSPSSTPRDGDRKANRTKTGLFVSSTLHPAVRQNGTSASGSSPAHAHPNTQKPWPSTQQTSPSDGSPRRATTRRPPGTGGKTANAHPTRSFSATIRSHPKSPGETQSSAAPTATNGHRFHQGAVPHTLTTSQRVPGVPKTHSPGVAGTGKPWSSSGWSYTPEPAPYAHRANADIALQRPKTLSREGREPVPRPPERKASVSRTSGNLAGAVKRPQRHSEEGTARSRDKIYLHESVWGQSPRLASIIDLTGDSDDDASAPRRPQPVSQSSRHPSASASVGSQSLSHTEANPKLDKIPAFGTPPSLKGSADGPPAPIQSRHTPLLPPLSLSGLGVGSKYNGSTIGNTNPKETPGSGVTSNSKDHRSTTTSVTLLNHGKRASDLINRDGVEMAKPTSSPWNSEARYNYVEILTNDTASRKRKVGSTSRDESTDDQSPKASSKTTTDDSPRGKLLRAHPMPSNGSILTSCIPSQISAPASASVAPEKPNGVMKRAGKHTISVTEAKRSAKISKFDTRALDSQIYAQDGCLPPPQGVALPQRESASGEPNEERWFLCVNPAIHGMHPRSEDWHAQKAAEIQKRPRRKAWFGKVHERERWLGSQENKPCQERNAAGVLGAGSFRKDPKAWTYRRPIDFGDVPEDELPADVRENPAWAKACERFREHRALKKKMDEAYLREQRKTKTKGVANGNPERNSKRQESPRREHQQHKQQQDPPRREHKGHEGKQQSETMRQEFFLKASQQARRFFEEVKNTPSPRSGGVRHVTRA